MNLNAKYYKKVFYLLGHKKPRRFILNHPTKFAKILFCPTKKISKRLRLDYFSILSNEEKRALFPKSHSQSSIVDTPTQKNHLNIKQETDDHKFLKQGAGYEDLDHHNRSDNPKVKAIAYYLPQFYPFDENNQWWGTGFTEWRNVTRGRPRFPNHYQPRLPRDLGYYDLRLEEVLRDQVKLARNAGLEGFCYYYYWFNGKRLMNKPTDLLLEKQDIDLPFCLMWANENWSRRWDGKDQDILIAQDYLIEHDEAFIHDLLRHFKDPRYIHLDNRPLFFIYRPNIIPQAKKRIKEWRRLFNELGGKTPLIYMVQGFEDIDPTPYDLDGAIEFPPHKVAKNLPPVVSLQDAYDPLFSGHYMDYNQMVAKSLSEKSFNYDVIKAVAPSWDNEARKPNKGMGFLNATPETYEHWLRKTVEFAEQNPIQGKYHFVGINAWNEWAEGAVLEPDVYWGAAYLNATRRALYGLHPTLKGKHKLILIGHDAHKHGAQLLTLHIFKTLKESFGIDVVCLILGSGVLIEEYEKIGKTRAFNHDYDQLECILNDYYQEGYKQALCNTVVSGEVIETVNKAGYNTTCLIHELESFIINNGHINNAKNISRYADKILFASSIVKDSFYKITEKKNEEKLFISPQGIYQQLTPLDEKVASHTLRQSLGIDQDTKIVVNLGFADERKGFDLYCELLKRALSESNELHFVWVGNLHKEMEQLLEEYCKNPQFSARFHLVSFTNDVSLYLQGADVFALTSREDPYPSVVLESLALGTPVIGFEGGGGYQDLIAHSKFGQLVPMESVEQMLNAINHQIKFDTEELKQERVAHMASTHDWSTYTFDLLRSFSSPIYKKVSVIIPNYNYEKHLEERLESIFNQHYPIYEIIVLDDKSTDESLSVVSKVSAKHNRAIRLIENETNSGSVFKQWHKGASFASGDYLWIAEADDSADASFLSSILSGDIDFDLCYTDSKQVDENGTHLADDYHYYYDDSMKESLKNSSTLNGEEIIRSCLSIKNQFMNVSSMVFKTALFQDTINKNLEELLTYVVAGDWLLYLKLLQNEGSTVKLIDQPLNIHRRHSKSVTHSNLETNIKEISEIHQIIPHPLKDESSQKVYLNELKAHI